MTVSGLRPVVRGMSRREQMALLLWLPLALMVFVNFQCAAVRGHSMEPTLANGAKLIVWKMVPLGTLKPGDVIVFRGNDGIEMVKRIACIHKGLLGLVPGVYRTHDGTSTPIPLALLFAPYLAARDMGVVGPPARDRTIYVIGDNFEDSYDSRDYGPISPDQVLGKVLF